MYAGLMHWTTPILKLGLHLDLNCTTVKFHDFALHGFSLLRWRLHPHEVNAASYTTAVATSLSTKQISNARRHFIVSSLNASEIDIVTVQPSSRQSTLYKWM